MKTLAAGAVLLGVAGLGLITVSALADAPMEPDLIFPRSSRQ